MSEWRTFPKIELHLHLEGAAPPDFIRDLARRKRADLGAIFDEQGQYRYEGFVDFLRVYEIACSVLQSPEDYHALTAAVLGQSADHNVIYTEIFVSPDFCGGEDSGRWKEYFAAITEAAEQQRAENGIEARFVATCVRHFGPEKAVRAAQRCVDVAGDWMVGFGMGGAEDFGVAADFAPAFAHAGGAGLPLTTHAGEFGGANSVVDSLNHLEGIRRIGHGVRSIEDPDLVQRLAAERITLEVNPGSNMALGIFPRWQDHPIDQLRTAGVPVTLSTDDPPYFHTNMTREFDMMEQTFGWARPEFSQVTDNALAAAFCDTATKSRLRNIIESA